MNFTSGRLAAAQSNAARMPASGPGKSATPSEITGNPNAANRAGSPLALRMSPLHCGSSRAITRCKIVRPPIVRIGLSPPPILRASPPASSTPGISGAPLGVASFITRFALALVACRLFLDIIEVLVVHDALGTRQSDEPLAARAPDQRQSDLPCQIDAPCRKTGARDQDRNSHPHRLDH